MAKSLFITVSILMAILFTASPVKAQQPESYPGYEEDAFMDMDFEPNLASPEVPRASHLLVTRYVKKIANSIKDRYTVDLMREGEVMVVTIPTDDLFLPNDTLLSNTAPKILEGLNKIVQDPYMWKVVIAVHTDDTGSEYYREFLSRNRLNSVYDWLISQMDSGDIPEDLIVIPFSMASSTPLNPNDTRERRAQNRRLEVYFIPGPEMIDKAEHHALF